MAHERINRLRFDAGLQEILETLPVQCRNDGCLVLSLLCHRDLWMYLLSVKSFDRFFGRGRYVVLNDGSLTSKDISILNNHISGLEICSAENFVDNRCPRNCSWERLLCASEYMKDYYVIILDSDVITQQPVQEVQDCVSHQHNFIMGVRPNQRIAPMPEVLEQRVVELGKKTFEDHCYLQELFDTNLDLIDGFRNFQYVTGISAFTGLAEGIFSKRDVISVCQHMTKIYGGRWAEWGSEQIAVSFLIANAVHSGVLPFPKYVTYLASSYIDYDQAAMVHFMGTHRFKNKYYMKRAKEVLKMLK